MRSISVTRYTASTGPTSCGSSVAACLQAAFACPTMTSSTCTIVPRLAPRSSCSGNVCRFICFILTRRLVGGLPSGHRRGDRRDLRVPKTAHGLAVTRWGTRGFIEKRRRLRSDFPHKHRDLRSEKQFSCEILICGCANQQSIIVWPQNSHKQINSYQTKSKQQNNNI